MKSIRIILCGVTFFLLLSTLAYSKSNFDTNTSELLIPELEVDKIPSFENVKVFFNFDNNTFLIIGAAELPGDSFNDAMADSVSDFDTNTSELLIPELDFDGIPSFRNVRVFFNFDNNTFSVTSFEELPDTLSDQIITESVSDEFSPALTVGTRGCERLTDSVVCHVHVTSPVNKGLRVAARGFELDPSAGIDDFGNEHTTSKLELELESGNKVSDLRIDNMLSANTPALYKFHFTTVSDVATKFSALNISLATSTQEPRIVTLENIDF